MSEEVRKFATLSWDITDLDLTFGETDEEKEAFLEKHEEAIRDAMIDAAIQTIYNLKNQED